MITAVSALLRLLRRVVTTVAIGLVAVLALALLSGCGTSQPPRPQSLVVLADVSGSVQASGLAARTEAQIDAAIEAAPDGTHLRVLLIDGASDASTCPPVKVDLVSVGTNTEDREASLKDSTEAATKAVAELMKCASTSALPGSDITGAFLATSNLLADMPAPVKILAITDGVQYAPDMTLKAIGVNDAATRSRTIESLRASGRLPDLHAAEVTFVGAGSGASALAPRTRANLQRWWSEYLAAGNASLDSYTL